ncbi:UMP kinase [Buchnera aphidicola]|uniref:Uridylate kinase n=1 Tax=Buchnera aphidicola (Cinara strobi) TaxID=1921549 RepID=A0A3B1DL71_9GAMM|nr:UMP kinase [Buchnera aphidicola]VAX76461.1 Uridylate kinase [Buchnera aphidicola (Cinara strobi)]
MYKSKKNKYNRILLKISGEFLKSSNESGINFLFLKNLISQIKLLVKLGIQVGLVVGGGNLFRGSDLEKIGMRRAVSDQIGMLSTVINALSIYEIMKRMNCQSRIFSSTTIGGICEKYRLDDVNQALENNCVVLFCFGLGVPFFTTDSSACVHGIAIKADIFLKGTKVDGVYSSDPNINESATIYHQLKYKDLINKELNVMDYTSLILASQHKLPILVFNMSNPKILYEILLESRQVGTLITE